MGEETLRNNWQNIKESDVLALAKPTQGYLCPLQANTYGIQFIYFKIRNVQTNATMCEISKRPEDIGRPLTENSRKIRYHFGPFFFMLNTIGTTLRFKVGPKPVNNFVMIERHYFKNKLIKSYEFNFNFCMPNSTNEVQGIYQLPELSNEEVEDMISHPWETVSDSFYFVNGKLIMHNKAQFSYAEVSKE